MQHLQGSAHPIDAMVPSEKGCDGLDGQQQANAPGLRHVAIDRAYSLRRFLGDPGASAPAVGATAELEGGGVSAATGRRGGGGGGGADDAAAAATAGHLQSKLRKAQRGDLLAMLCQRPRNLTTTAVAQVVCHTCGASVAVPVASGPHAAATARCRARMRTKRLRMRRILRELEKTLPPVLK